MSEEKTTGQEDQTWKASSEAWKEVGEQFASLGESIAGAFRTLWENEDNQQVLKGMQDGLTSMARAVTDAVDEAAVSPEGQKFRAEAEHFVQSTHDAGKRAVEDVRPHLLSALEQINASLKSVITQFREKDAPDEEV